MEKKRDRTEYKRQYNATHPLTEKDKERHRRNAHDWYARNKEQADAAQRARRALLSPSALPVLAEVWPYDGTGWPIELVNAAVPTHWNYETRADVCQEVCLRLVTGEADEDTLSYHVKEAARKVFGMWGTVHLSTMPRDFEIDMGDFYI